MISQWLLNALVIHLTRDIICNIKRICVKHNHLTQFLDNSYTFYQLNNYLLLGIVVATKISRKDNLLSNEGQRLTNK